MATYTSNYAWTKPSGNDNVDISVLNANLDSQDSIIHDAFMNMAQAFSESSTYEVGDIVVYQTTTYKCHTAVTTAGPWTGSTNWQVYKLSEGGGGGLTLGETSSTAYRGDRGKTAYDHSQIVSGNPHGTTAADVGLGNVPNVSTNDQTPTFTEASTRNNIASGEKLSVIMGKIQKFFNDLKTVAFSGSFTDLSNKPENANTFQGTIAEWNQLSTAEKKAYDHASIPDSLDGNVTFPANKVMLTGGGNVEDRLESPLAIDSVTAYSNYQHITLMSSGTAASDSITLTDDCIVIAIVTGVGTHSVYYGKPTASTIMLYPSSGQSDITMMALSKDTVITGNATGNGSCVSVVAIPLVKLLNLGS